MGHLKEKYTRQYFLGSVDKKTNKIYGAGGFESFKCGYIDKRYTKFLRTLNLKGKAVLDIGCGRGEVVNYCAKRGAKRVFGIDFSKDAIKIASEHNQNNCNVELIEMEAKDIKFENVFDIVFAFDVIEHIPDEEMQLIYSKIHTALRKNGILILHTPTFESSEDKDNSDFIPVISGMHCNKQTEGKLNSDLVKHKFRKYSLNVWSKSEKFSLSIFLYANAVKLWDFLLRLRLRDRISHPKRTFSNLCKRLFISGEYKRR